jgi:hypothetical protein
VNDSGKKPNFYNAAAITVVKSFLVQSLVLKNFLWSYIFAFQARNYQSKFLALLKTRVGKTDSDKHTSLLRWGNNDSHKKFYSKCQYVKITIYGRN